MKNRAPCSLHALRENLCPILDLDKYGQLLNAADVELKPFVVNGEQLVAQLDANIYTVTGIHSP